MARRDLPPAAVQPTDLFEPRALARLAATGTPFIVSAEPPNAVSIRVTLQSPER
jgi:hypothetical protein